MNDTLNRLICSGLEPVVTPAAKPSDVLYFYAKEAVALGNTELADRYFLEVQNNFGYYFVLLKKLYISRELVTMARRVPTAGSTMPFSICKRKSLTELTNAY